LDSFFASAGTVKTEAEDFPQALLSSNYMASQCGRLYLFCYREDLILNRIKSFTLLLTLCFFLKLLSKTFSNNTQSTMILFEYVRTLQIIV